MPSNRSPKATALVSGSGLTIMLFMIFAAADFWPWRIVYGAIAMLLLIKVVVALRSRRPDASQFEHKLRRLAFVD